MTSAFGGVIALVAGAAIAGEAPKYRLGETIQLTPEVRLRVATGSLAPFGEVKVNGVDRVFELRFDVSAESRGRGVMFLEPSKDSGKSTIVLRAGGARVAPKAIAVTRATGKNEVWLVDELEMSKEGRGLTMIFLKGNPAVHLLFDMPNDLSRGPTSLAIDLNLDGKSTPIEVL